MVDVEAEYLGLSVQGWREMIRNWWDLALGYVLIASIFLGSGYIVFLLCRRAKQYWKERKEITVLPTSIERVFTDLRKSILPLRLERNYPKESKSFGVFLGSFNTPPTNSQTLLLSQWDIIVLDPFQAGVLEALARTLCTSKHVLGRVDIGLLAMPSKSAAGSAEITRTLSIVAQAVVQSFRRVQDMHSPFTGILLAKWEAHFPPPVCNELVRYLNAIGFDVYLEVSPPNYLSERVSQAIEMEPIRGVICRNGSIFPNGERRNYFQMAEMRHSLRALAAKSAMIHSTVMMWETIDDHVKLEHAVVKRSFTWCNFSSALSWVGPRRALTDADVAVAMTVTGEPLGAMMWLKENATKKVHEIWRTNDQITENQCGDHAIYDTLNDFIPGLASKLALTHPHLNQALLQATAKNSDDFEWPWSIHPAPTNLPQLSSHGLSVTEFGCIQLGLYCSLEDNAELVQQQSRLRDLKLLELLRPEELHEFGERLHSLYKAQNAWAMTIEESLAVEDLSTLLTAARGGEGDGIKVYVGLDSGFRTTSTTRFCQFWGLFDYEISTGVINIYISGKTTDRIGSILHTFMSSKEFSRAQCFMAEIALAEQENRLVGDWKLPARLQRDIELLTPAETILFMQRLAVQGIRGYPMLVTRIQACCEHQLLAVPSIQQLRALNATAYLQGMISAEELVMSRLNWYAENNIDQPSTTAAICLFKEIDNRVSEVLMGRESNIVVRLELVLQTILRKKEIDASADIFCLSVFCAFRKLAINEVYMEINDRNPLPHPQSDQSACFAEMFALGSGCEQYFDMTPTALGKILAEMSQKYWQTNQPPAREDFVTELPTAYSSKLIDLDPNAGKRKIPLYYHVTFLGIFAIPAFIDILLLTTMGRGLYLTTYMSEIEKSMATTALMTSLFLCGAIGTWVSSGGSYYLHSMTFSAMNMFVLTRFIAGLSICLAGGSFALVIIGVTKGFYAGFIFMIYFFILNTYLTLLATLSIYQFPGFNFQSGRMIIMTRIPILLISPVLTLFIHKHDLIIYLITLIVFVISLLFGARTIMAQWSAWYLDIPCVTDVDVARWYSKAYPIDEATSEKPSTSVDISTTPIPRQTLLRHVLKERNRRPWQKATTDAQVLSLAQGYEATVFMMDWYCKYTRAKMPYAYSPTWNLQCKAAVCTLQDMQKGVKLHNAFVHWRNAGDELWGGVLYFIIALLDKWVALISGGSIVGLSDASSETFRLAVGFGLAYYLIGAVFLDGVSQPLWQIAQKNLDQAIVSLESIKSAAVKNVAARRVLYWKYFTKFFFIHIWGLAFTSALMWTFDNSRDGTIMYLAYVGAYTGLLWYQYNRIFTGPLAFKEPLVAVIAGLTVGLLLHRIRPRFSFNSVIALAVATWTAAFFSVWTAMRGPRPKYYDTGLGTSDKIHTSTGLSHDHQPSKNELMETVESICALPEELRYRLDPFAYPGVEVVRILTSRDNSNHSMLVHTAFPNSDDMVRKAAEFWIKGETIVDLVPMRHLLEADQKTRSITRVDGNRLHVFVFLGLDIVGDEWVMDIRRNCKVIAEAIIQATCEFKFGYTHEHSMLAEVLAVSYNRDSGVSIPEGVMRQLRNSAKERRQVIQTADKVLLQQLLLGLDCDVEWDLLPKSIRSFFLKRACGEPCRVSDTQLQWISSKFGHGNTLDIEGYIARCNLGATLTVLVNSFAAALEADYTHRDLPEPLDTSYERCIEMHLSPTTLDKQTALLYVVKRPFVRFHHAFKHIVKFFSVALVADPEMQRELNYSVKNMPWILRVSTKFILNTVWNYTKSLQRMIIPMVIFHGRVGISRIHCSMKGMATKIKKDFIAVESVNGVSTCFIILNSDGTSTLRQYSGQHKKDPTGLYQLLAVNTYSKNLILIQREEYAKEALVNRFSYEYYNDSGGKMRRRGNSKQPTERQCTAGVLNGQLVFYDERGYITSGSFIKDDNLVQFKFEYRKNAKFDDELLRAEYILPHIAIQVVWSVPPANHSIKKLEKWIPHTKVTEAIYTQGPQVYRCKWHYEHKFHPIISTFLNGQEVDTPPMISHDWFGVLQKPRDISFINEDPLYSFTSVKTNIFTRSFLGWNTRWQAISTSRARTHLWKSWKERKDLDACTARWLDEWSLRNDKDLKPYWNARDIGRLEAGEKYMNSRADTIMARIEIDPEISSWTPLAFKISDLVSFGTGGDARINTRTQEAQIQDTDTELHVLAMDTGTWPNEGGGVSACRRDMVNNLNSIRWHIVAENANDFGVPKFQIERNIQSLTVLPLWGMDFLTPTHGIFQNCLDSSIQHKIHNLRDDDIKKRFLPILKTLVRGSRSIVIDRQIIEDSTKALVDLNSYFESSRHWGEVWKSDLVKQAWREMWLTEDMPNCRSISQWLEAERPTLLHLDNALDMWHRYLFIFSIPVPEKIPDVFQASHHFVGASYGIVCKVKRKCSFHVWDHCVSWREVTVFLSSSMSFDSPFVCNSLISLSKLASTLILHHADVVLPCADFFNPGWEVEIGTQENTIEHRKSFTRKIDPVVNGICNMESFKPIEKIKSKVPTVVMLSHVRFVKDIKTAILAADMIVNVWGFTDYQLHIYGDMEKAPSYSVECQEIIAAKSLRDNVVLKGLGSPSKVLEDAWLFLNSSVSEGLPLAMGEAALTGVPVVCTDVGASFRVVTDPVTWDQFSAVVAPNDAVSLARAQINVLALLDEWSQYAADSSDLNPKMSANPTKEEVAAIQERMYAKQEQRRNLGMRGRDNVLSSFSEGRYLREHEQMLWIGKYQAPSYKARVKRRRLSDLSSYIYDDGKISHFTSTTSSFETPYGGGSSSPSTTDDTSNTESSVREPVICENGSGETSYASSMTIMERPLVSHG